MRFRDVCGRGRLALLGGLAVLAGACAPNAPQDFLKPEGPIARDINSLTIVTLILAGIVFVVVEGLLVYALIRFRSGRQTEDPAQVHGNTRMEVAWTIAPALLLAALAVPTVGQIFALGRVPDDPIRVNVKGLQWWWQYEYEDFAFTTANELHIPTDRAVYLTMTSRDVIHSYWVPKLAGKQDVVPGRTTHLTIRADKPGPYMGQCVEFCGASHANMRLRVFAHEPADFQRWVDNQKRGPVEPSDALAQRGKQLFQGGACIGCHVIEGISDLEDPIGPNLTHFGERTTFAGSMFPVTEENLKKWLADPPEMKPGSLMPDLGLSDEDIEALTAYLLTLK